MHTYRAASRLRSGFLCFVSFLLRLSSSNKGGGLWWPGCMLHGGMSGTCLSVSPPPSISFLFFPFAVGELLARAYVSTVAS